MKENNNEETKFGLLNIIVVILSLYVMIALIIDTFFKLSKETSELLRYLDNAICIFFFIEFLIRFFKSDNKLNFMKWGWIDLISSLPMIDSLRAGRLIRLIRLFRIIRAFRSTKNLVNHIFKNKAEGALTSVTAIAILLIIFSSIAILQVETAPKSNIKTAEDAIWWSYVTITTVGYGDLVPVTTEGRIIAALLMTAGMGIFGIFTAFIASLFVSDRREN
jgi:voltage-gated potassium channel